MATGTFDLVRAISKLLAGVREFRTKLKSAQPMMEQFRVANKRFESALEEQTELLKIPLPEHQPDRRKVEAHRHRVNAKVEKLRQKNTDSWNCYLASVAFIRPFLNEVELVLQRLPLKPEWHPFPDAIRSLRITGLGAWARMPPNHDLETLEIRLTEMRDLAKADARGKLKSALGYNIDRLRKECGWSFDQLANRTNLNKKLILGHVNRNRGAHPSTLKIYADTFSAALRRLVTVAELENLPQD